MTVHVRIIVESDGHSGGTHRMEKAIDRGSANIRFYPSEIQHALVELGDWAAGGMANLIGPERALTDKDALMVVNQRDFIANAGHAQAYRDALSDRGTSAIVPRDRLTHLIATAEAHERLVTGPSVYVNADEYERLRQRDALLSAMEAAGVDNWEGMDNVVRPQD